jgi:DUF1680 family protein
MTSQMVPSTPDTTPARTRSRGRPVVPSGGRLRPLGLSEVRLEGGFWGARQAVNARATLRHIEEWLERTGWLGNFDLAATGRLPAGRTGREFSDTEVYKLLEAMAWELGREPDPALEARFHAVVARVAAAQEPDGYLNTYFGRPGQDPRWSALEWGHELYAVGHLVQAAVARARTGHDDQLVTVARRAADLVCEVFGEGGIRSVCGHAEIEPALVELYRVTGETRYLEQARLFVERRGHQVLADVEYGRAYFQDDVPVREADVLRGHAVRATYLAAGAVDVAVESGDAAMLSAVTRQWRRTVARRTYVTGGIGSRHQDEAFGEDFVLPPDRAYSETCAAIGSVMLAWRLMLAHGGAEYADLVERTLFNVVATSPSREGTAFFYTNTLHQREHGTVPDPDRPSPRAAASLRAPWFEVSCCPTNVARTFASLGGYVATVDDDGLQLHQYAAGTVRAVLDDGREVGVQVATRYPQDGVVRLTVLEGCEGRWALSLRVPAWAGGAVVRAGGQAVPADAPVAVLDREWSAGDVVELRLPVAPRFTEPDPRIDAVRGCVAVERGPEVLCVESVDLPDGVSIDELRVVTAVPPREVDGRVLVTCRRVVPAGGAWPYRSLAADGASVLTDDVLEIPLVPYHDWANRGPATMRVWLPTA